MENIMNTLGFYADAPYKIVNEGREITLRLQKTSPTTAVITWNIPKGAPGCSIDDLSYNGIVFVADTTPIKLEQSPTNQVFYSSDATVDFNIHAGDKIGSGLVIGSLYDDKTTTSLEISGLTPNTPYYIAGFAVNNVGEYHQEGVHTYSQSYRETDFTNPDKPGMQYVQLGISPTDNTGLNPVQTYPFSITIDSILHDINIIGSSSTTYQDLVNTINDSLSLLSSPFQGSTPPNYGSLYVSSTTKQLGIWDGQQYILQDTIVSSSSPTNPTVGDFWCNSSTNTVHMWNGTNWIQQQFIKFDSDPSEVKCDTYWLNDTAGYKWNGSIWIPIVTYTQSTDPVKSNIPLCNSFWFNTNNNSMFKWEPISGSCDGTSTAGSWIQTDVLVHSGDPRTPTNGEYWFNDQTNILHIYTVTGWSETPVIISEDVPPASSVGDIWFNTSEEVLFSWNGVSWVEIANSFVIWSHDPSQPLAGELWWENYLYMWDELGTSWVIIDNLIEQSIDPALDNNIVTGSLWNNSIETKEWDGMQWITPCIIQYHQNPTNLPLGTIWFNPVDNTWFTKSVSGWDQQFPICNDVAPTLIPAGQYWFNPISNMLFTWNGISWIPLMFSSTPINNQVNSEWYNTTERTLYYWTGTEWKIKSVPYVLIDEEGCLKFVSGTTGSTSSINVVDGGATGLFVSLTPAGRIQPPIAGTDGVSNVPSYIQIGVGTDGSSEERREMVENILIQLGYPTVQVELTKQQLEFCVNRGLQTLRRAGSSGYERVYFFINLKAGQQHYVLSDKTVGFNKIVEIMKIHRTTSAFLGSAEGQGVYGQVVLQHLYSMGNFDLVSYHIINEYIELMEKMFAADIMYSWKEKTRTLSIKQNLWRDERILVDAVIERTEQEILTDRYLNNWIQNWATSEACMILAETRGKFSSLPGAGGGISLNSSDLRARGERGFEQCMKELDDFVANDIEEFGGGASFIMG